MYLNRQRGANDLLRISESPPGSTCITSFGSEIMLTRFNGRKKTASTMTGISHFTKLVYVGIICNCIYHIQFATKSTFKSALKKRPFNSNSTDINPLQTWTAYRNLDKTSASNTMFSWGRGRLWSQRSFRCILWLHVLKYFQCEHLNKLCHTA